MKDFDLTGFDLQEKEQRILEAAINVFSEKGFSAATTSEIAKQAKVAEGTIFRYFKTKKDILRGILIHTINLLSHRMVMENVEKMLLNCDGKDIRTILKEFVYDRMKLVDKIFPMARVILTESLFHEDVREALYTNIIEKALGIFKVFYKKMSDNGMIRKDVEPDVLLRSIFGNIAILIAQKKLYGNKFEKTNLDEEIDKMIDVLLFGIANERSNKV
jgi:AcrR family transcriptional regulator